jgi:hypothetical protein
MIDGFIKVKNKRIDESPECRTEIVLSASCDCGCEYQANFVVEDNQPAKVVLRAHQDAFAKIKHWLQTDRHGSQLRPHPVQNPAHS